MLSRPNNRAALLLSIILFALLIVAMMFMTSNKSLNTLGKLAMYNSDLPECAAGTNIASYYRHILHKHSKGEPSTWEDYRDSLSIYSPRVIRPVRLYINENIYHFGSLQTVKSSENEMICLINDIYDRSISFNGLSDQKETPEQAKLLLDFTAFVDMYPALKGKLYGYPRTDKRCPRAKRDYRQNIWALEQLFNSDSTWSDWASIAPMLSEQDATEIQKSLIQAQKEIQTLTNTHKQIESLVCLLTTGRK